MCKKLPIEWNTCFMILACILSSFTNIVTRNFVFTPTAIPNTVTSVRHSYATMIKAPKFFWPTAENVLTINSSSKRWLRIRFKNYFSTFYYHIFLWVSPSPPITTSIFVWSISAINFSVAHHTFSYTFSWNFTFELIFSGAGWTIGLIRVITAVSIPITSFPSF